VIRSKTDTENSSTKSYSKSMTDSVIWRVRELREKATR